MKLNRISAALIALFMVLAMLPAAIADENTSTLTMVPKLTEDGSQLVLAFELETKAQPLSGVVDLYYDSDCLKNPVPSSDALPGQSSSFVFNTETEGNALIAFASSVPMQTGEIFVVTFDLVKDACTPDTEIVFSVDIENSELIDYDTTTLLDFAIDDVRFTFPSDEPAFEKGDVNRNHGIDSGDATLILRGVVGAVELDEEQQYLGDMNNNNGLDTGDATLVLRAVVAQS